MENTKIDEQIERNLELMKDEIALHESCKMENEGVFVEEIDDKPVEKSFSDTMHELLKDFSK